MVEETAARVDAPEILRAAPRRLPERVRSVPEAVVKVNLWREEVAVTLRSLVEVLMVTSGVEEMVFWPVKKPSWPVVPVAWFEAEVEVT